MKNQTTFKPGEGGRPKGCKNKVTTDVKEFLNNFVNDNLETIQRDFDNLESKDRLLFFEKLLKYIIPTKAEQIVKPQISEYEDWTKEQIEAELKRLEDFDNIGIPVIEWVGSD
jgi:hypothetical protein